MRGNSWAALLLVCFLGNGTALAHSVSQRLGGYRDSSGMNRERVNFEGQVDGKGGHGGMTGSTLNLDATRDQYEDDNYSDEKNQYEQDVYGSSRRTNDAATVAATQTWDRLVETRQMASYATDKKVSSRSWALGFSQWLHHETIRLGYDVSRTIIDQPLYQVLDYDSQEVGNPTVASSIGLTVSVRHLATPTTVVDYSASHIEVENRPVQHNGTIAVRQFIVPFDGAVHVSATRADNRGYVTTESNYGQVNAWIGETAYLQNLWQGGRCRVAYRFYQEDEVTRAFGDRKRLGSDTATLAMSQDLDKRAIDSIGVPLTLEVAGSRYANNAGISAGTFELGVTAKF